MTTLKINEMLVREINLLKLESFCRSVNEACGATGFSGSRVADLWEQTISATCTQCGASVDGRELFGLSMPPCSEYSTAHIGRLRNGYCARVGCEGWIYRVEFHNSLLVNWIKILPNDEERPARKPALRIASPVSPAGPALLRAVAAIFVIMLLLVAREWWLGGSIPLVREPEKYKVDVPPPGVVHGDHALPVDE